MSLARVPKSSQKSVVAKIVRNFTITTNAAGYCSFIFLPHIINDSSNVTTSTSPFWLCNATGAAANATDVVTGFTALNIGSIINPAFSAGRAISAHIELIPNLSLTTAQGRGIIAMTTVKSIAGSPALDMKPGDTSASRYSLLQLQETMLAAQNNAVCFVQKMEGLQSSWVPNETNDILGYPVINYNLTPNANAYYNTHADENFIFGLFTGLPASSTINVATYTNIELITDSASTSGLFPLISEYCLEKADPISNLRDRYVSGTPFCSVIPFNN